MRKRTPNVARLPLAARIAAATAVVSALVCALADSGAGVVGVNEQTRRLEEIFLSLTQNGGEAA